MRRFRLLLPLLAPHRTAILLGFLSVALAQLAASYVPQAMRWAIDALATTPPDLEACRNYALLLIGLTAFRGVFQFFMRWLIVGTSRQLSRRLRDLLYARLLRQSPRFLASHHTGDLLSRFTADVEAVRWSIGPGVMYVASTIVIAPLCITILWTISPLLTVLNLVPLLGLAVGTKLLAPRMHAASVDVQESQAGMSTRAQESFAGVRVVKSFAREDREVESFAEQAEHSLDANVRFVNVRSLFHPMVGLLRGAGLVLTLLVGGSMILGGTLTIGEFVAVHLYRGMLMWPMISLGWVMSQWERGKVAMARLASLLEDTPDIDEPADPIPLETVRGEIEVDGLTFTYPGAERSALEDVSLRVPAGGTVAVVGPTGAGKSTLLAQIPRLLDAPHDAIRLDGVPVERLPLARLRRAIGFVPQDTFLFSESIHGNVAYGLEGGGDPAEERKRVEEAAGQALLRRDVERFPRGFDTLLGERGVNLSGGQKQRTAIARAIAIDPPVLLLDDCLSAVDAHTEAEILRNLREVLRGRTTLLATHRVAAARLADRIVVLDEGRVVEEGTHEELVAGGGFYARLAARQALVEALDAA